MTPEELEARRLAEEAEAQRLAQEAEATNPMMQPTDLIGQQGQQETGDTNPLLTAGLGLGSGFVASQTGGAPATSQVLSSFAQKVAAQDAANLAAQRAKTPTKQITPNNIIGGGANLGVADTSIRGLDPSNRKVDFMSDGTGVLNGVSLFTGGAKTTGNNYADVVNADNARKAQEAEYAAAAEAEAVADANAFVPPLDFAGEIQNNPEQYSGLIENNPFTSLGGTPVEDNEFTVAPAVQESPAPTAAQEFRPVGGGFSFGGDTPIPADREGGFIPEREGFFTLTFFTFGFLMFH